jgi:hypothetical protein
MLSMPILSVVLAAVTPPGNIIPATPAVNVGAPAAAEASSAPPQTRWYGGPALVLDASVVALFTATAVLPHDRNQTPSTLTFVASGIGIIVGVGLPALNHANHAHTGRAAASSLLRLATAVGGLALAVSVFDHACASDSLVRCDGVAIFAVSWLPLLGVMVVDDLVLARGAEPAARPQTASIAPAVSFSREGAPLLSVAGRF